MSEVELVKMKGSGETGFSGRDQANINLSCVRCGSIGIVYPCFKILPVISTFYNAFLADSDEFVVSKELYCDSERVSTICTGFIKACKISIFF